MNHSYKRVSTLIILFAVLSCFYANSQTLHLKNVSLPCLNKNYNIIAHVAVDSLNRPLFTRRQVENALQKVSEFFEPICISFENCEYQVMQEDWSLGILKNKPLLKDQRILELRNRYSKRRRINIFFLDEIDLEYCGQSTFDGLQTLKDANIFVERQCDWSISGQIAHHLGHIFGLRNTYDLFSIELVDGSNCLTTGDLLCDTPADPYGQNYIYPADQEAYDNNELYTGYVDEKCEFVYELKDPNGEYYQPDVGNAMSAYPCKCGFTVEQYLLMAENYRKSIIKHF